MQSPTVKNDENNCRRATLITGQSCASTAGASTSASADIQRSFSLNGTDVNAFRRWSAPEDDRFLDGFQKWNLLYCFMVVFSVSGLAWLSRCDDGDSCDRYLFLSTRCRVYCDRSLSLLTLWSAVNVFLDRFYPVYSRWCVLDTHARFLLFSLSFYRYYFRGIFADCCFRALFSLQVLFS